MPTARRPAQFTSIAASAPALDHHNQQPGPRSRRAAVPHGSLTVPPPWAWRTNTGMVQKPVVVHQPVSVRAQPAVRSGRSTPLQHPPHQLSQLSLPLQLQPPAQKPAQTAAMPGLGGISRSPSMVSSRSFGSGGTSPTSASPQPVQVPSGFGESPPVVVATMVDSPSTPVVIVSTKEDGLTMSPSLAGSRLSFGSCSTSPTSTTPLAQPMEHSMGGTEACSNIEEVSSPECQAADQDAADQLTKGEHMKQHSPDVQRQCSELQAKYVEALEEVAALQDSEAEAPTRLQSEVGSRQESTNDSVESTEDDVVNVTDQCAAALPEEAPASPRTDEVQPSKGISSETKPPISKRWFGSLPVGRGSIGLQWTKKVGLSKRPRHVSLIVVMAFVLVMIRFLVVGSAPSPSVSSLERDPLLMLDRGATFCKRPGFLSAPAVKRPSARGQ
eukprot:CAMPEP_0204562546 /NCGR_PEP_ID=MMETSP0661-20131031/33810_1 /ASSEMBLY_ACC=CAM_ASM_000606 /TAXON_ID=109239 /ORGANISM="Alexandrium margalefi, Strain AMGDE01CS-322" /LENGTH=441 /DNA_ID=CAMNT_0051570037 /DNA_START=76 /DNA_END=1404 /DNA_ORIENTATION=-